jgi:drug/metabolite transporter (DMT)-like permease
MWLLVAVAGYVLSAVSQASDKYLLRHPSVGDPLVLSFWLAALSFFVILLFPFGLTWPGLPHFSLAFGAGIVFFLSILAFYLALYRNEASRAVTIVGGLTPVVVLLLSYLLLGESLERWQWAGFFLLVSGGLLASLDGDRRGRLFSIDAIPWLLLAILLTAAYLVYIKYVYEKLHFLNGFVWSRMGASAAGLSLLASPSFRRKVFAPSPEKQRLGLIFIAANVCAGIGEILVNLAIAKGNVALVNALRGTEYVFLFFMALFLSKKRPDILKEPLGRKTVLLKALSILTVCAGLAALMV